MSRPRVARHGMRLLHTSDTHLGHQQYPRTGPDGLNVRETDIYTAWDRIITAAVEDPPDLFVHAGDLFDGVRPGNRALAAALEGFLRLSRAGIPTVVIAGNHEHPRMRATGSAYRLLEHLDHIHPVYKGHREQLDLPTAAGPVRVQAVPQCADALAAEVAAIEPADVPQLLVLHGAVTHLEAFTHAEFNEQPLDPAWFDDRFDYVALGHFHGAREITPRAWYCGAPERVSMAESGEEKGYLDVRLDAAAPGVRFCPLDGRPYADLVPIDAATLDAPGVLDAARSALRRVPDGAVARLRLNDLHPDLRGSLDAASLRDAAAHALHLDLRMTWQDTHATTAGALELGGVWEEFEAFMATQPVERQDRAALTALAREVLTGEVPP